MQHLPNLSDSYRLLCLLLSHLRRTTWIGRHRDWCTKRFCCYRPLFTYTALAFSSFLLLTIALHSHLHSKFIVWISATATPHLLWNSALGVIIMSPSVRFPYRSTACTRIWHLQRRAVALLLTLKFWHHRLQEGGEEDGAALGQTTKTSYRLGLAKRTEKNVNILPCETCPHHVVMSHWYGSR